MSTNDYGKLLELDTKNIQMNICDFITFLRQSNCSYATISLYVAAIRKFYDMNDLSLNWRKVIQFMGEHEKTVEDRPYTHSEISLLLQNATQRNRSIILLMCSAGLRVGAISLLRIKDLEPIDKYSIYKINVYARSKRSNYFSFCTPEIRKIIIKANPNSEKAQKIIARRQREEMIDRFNKQLCERSRRTKK